jgi:hypothetical protein
LSRKASQISFISVHFGHSIEDMLELPNGIPKQWYECLPTQGVLRTVYVGSVPRAAALEISKKYVSVATENLEGPIWE